MQQMAGSDIDIVFRSNDLDDGLPQIEVKIDRVRACSFGISVTSIANEINYCINGKTATTFRKDGEDYDVVVLLADEDRKEIPDLEKIFVEGSGGRYSVANFATVERGTGPVTINREDQTRIIHLTANAVGESNAGEIENKIKSIIEENIVVPDGISLTFDGSWGNTRETGKVFVLITNLFTLSFIYSLFNKGADKKDMSGIPQELIDSINGSEKE